MNENKNIIVAVVISISIMLGFNYFFGNKIEPEKKLQTTSEVIDRTSKDSNAEKLTEQTKNQSSVELKIQERIPIPIKSANIVGSLNLRGALLDDVKLVKYRETTENNSPLVALLHPENTKNYYFFEFGWTGSKDMPNRNTVWKIIKAKEDMGQEIALTPMKPLMLEFINKNNIIFRRTFKIDENYLVTVEDEVTNNSKESITIIPFSSINRKGRPQTESSSVLHEGVVGYVGSKLQEIDYKDMEKTPNQSFQSNGGSSSEWFGFTDKYWLTSLVFNKSSPANINLSRTVSKAGDDQYLSKVSYEEKLINRGNSIKFSQKAFVGAKALNIIESYEKNSQISKFDLSIDFGWFYFLTKPLFYILEYLNKIFGNVGVSIIILTILTKLLAFPLALKTQRSMGNMKTIQPKIQRLKEMCGDDKVRFNKEVMELYQKEKINPLSGCLPMLIQAPIFFCLYKVFFVTIEMRHAPFFGWIHDLSAPDPTTIFNLFGLLPFTPPSFLKIGAWPLIMGGTMFLQQKLTPQPQDPNQAKAMMVLPLVFTFMFASFPAGLVIYWTCSNILSMLQQIVITRFIPTRIPGILKQAANGSKYSNKFKFPKK